MGREIRRPECWCSSQILMSLLLWARCNNYVYRCIDASICVFSPSLPLVYIHILMRLYVYLSIYIYIYVRVHTGDVKYDIHVHRFRYAHVIGRLKNPTLTPLRNSVVPLAPIAMMLVCYEEIQRIILQQQPTTKRFGRSAVA